MGQTKRKFFLANEGGSSHSEGGGEGPAPFGGESVSLLLRNARLRHGYELRDVATTLRIRFVYLQAIEDGQYAELPGTAYAIGFLRTYADYLGLEADVVVRRFKEEIAGKVGRQDLYFPTPAPEVRIPGGTILLMAVVLAGVVYGVWYYLSSTDRSVVDLVPTLPQRLVSLLEVKPPAPPNPPIPPPRGAALENPGGESKPASAENPGGVGATPAIGVGGVAPSGQASAANGGAPGSVDSSGDNPDEVPLVTGTNDDPRRGNRPALVPGRPSGVSSGPAATAVASSSSGPASNPPGADVSANSSSSSTASVTPAAPPVPTGKVYGAQHRESRVQIRAVVEAWMRIRDANGDILFTGVLRPGDVYRVPDRAGARLRTRNAGGVVAIVDGGEVGPLGSNGQVLKDMLLDPAKLAKPNR
ncbi:cytoskeleton protein RodZ [Azospirillaceae bacterium]